MFKSPTEYAAQILEITGGNKFEAVKVLMEAQEQYKMPRSYIIDVFNIITGN